MLSMNSMAYTWIEAGCNSEECFRIPVCEHLKLMLTPWACKNWARNLLKNLFPIWPETQGTGTRVPATGVHHSSPSSLEIQAHYGLAQCGYYPAATLPYQCKGYLTHAPHHKLCPPGWITPAVSEDMHWFPVNHWQAAAEAPSICSHELNW